MSKEYTYDIDKYTIGVDTNGEDGIGMTVAKIENGELHFLGNCYGENARCIDLLIKENQELKKQLENCYCNRTDCIGRIKDSKQYDSLEQKVEKQQKEFIKWLENGIEKVKNTEFLDERIQRAGLIAYNRCLQKYKKIIGVSDENNIK